MRGAWSCRDFFTARCGRQNRSCGARFGSGVVQMALRSWKLEIPLAMARSWGFMFARWFTCCGSRRSVPCLLGCRVRPCSCNHGTVMFAFCCSHRRSLSAFAPPMPHSMIESRGPICTFRWSFEPRHTPPPPGQRACAVCRSGGSVAAPIGSRHITALKASPVYKS